MTERIPPITPVVVAPVPTTTATNKSATLPGTASDVRLSQQVPLQSLAQLFTQPAALQLLPQVLNQWRYLTLIAPEALMDWRQWRVEVQKGAQHGHLLPQLLAAFDQFIHACGDSISHDAPQQQQLRDWLCQLALNREQWLQLHQDSLHWQLPIFIGDKCRTVQGKIRKRKQANGRIAWSLNLLLPIDEREHVLAMSELDGEQIQLEFYCENQTRVDSIEAQRNALNTMLTPLCDTLSIQIQLGDVPSDLNRPSVHKNLRGYQP